MCIELDWHTARQLHSVKPSAAPLDSFEEVVETMKVREYRKDFFIRECRRIGALLAERMEDAEGWHDASRIEPAKRSLNPASLGLGEKYGTTQ